MSRQQRITDFHSANAVQVAALDELRKRFSVDGLDAEANLTRRAILELELTGEPGERVARAMPHIKALRARMHEIGEPELAKAVEKVRRCLVRYADPTLEDTQEIDVEALGLRKKDP